MPPVTTPPIKAMSNVIVIYDSTDITAACNTAQLAAAVNEIETTNLASTGKETTPGQSEWTIDVGGSWSKALDDEFGADIVEGQTNKKNCSIQFGPLTNRVTYTWTAKAMVSNYTIDASNPSEALNWSGTLTLSGAPARATA